MTSRTSQDHRLSQPWGLGSLGLLGFMLSHFGIARAYVELSNYLEAVLQLLFVRWLPSRVFVGHLEDSVGHFRSFLNPNRKRFRLGLDFGEVVRAYMLMGQFGVVFNLCWATWIGSYLGFVLGLLWWGIGMEQNGCNFAFWRLWALIAGHIGVTCGLTRAFLFLAACLATFSPKSVRVIWFPRCFAWTLQSEIPISIEALYGY